MSNAFAMLKLIIKNCKKQGTQAARLHPCYTSTNTKSMKVTIYNRDANTFFKSLRHQAYLCV